MRVIDLTITLVCWGLWAFFPKLAQKQLGDATSAIVYQYAGSLLLIVLIGLSQARVLPVWEPRGALYAVLAGVAAAIGSVFYYRALGSIDVSVASAMTALYPSVAILLGWLVLDEKLEPRQWIGVGLALVSVVLIAPRS